MSHLSPIHCERSNPLVFAPRWHHRKVQCFFPVSSFEGEIQILIIHLQQLAGVTCESLKHGWKTFRRGNLGISSTPPGPPGWFLSVCETPQLDGDRGRGRDSVTRGVFLGSGMFSVWNSLSVEFQREAVIPETGKCYKQYGNAWPLLALPPPPALLPCVVVCCQERIYTTDHVRVCACVCNKWTRSISWGLFDWTDVVHVFCFFF